MWDILYNIYNANKSFIEVSLLWNIKLKFVILHSDASTGKESLKFNQWMNRYRMIIVSLV